MAAPVYFDLQADMRLDVWLAWDVDAATNAIAPRCKRVGTTTWERLRPTNLPADAPTPEWVSVTPGQRFMGQFTFPQDGWFDVTADANTAADGQGTTTPGDATSAGLVLTTVSLLAPAAYEFGFHLDAAQAPNGEDNWWRLRFRVPWGTHRLALEDTTPGSSWRYEFPAAPATLPPGTQVVEIDVHVPTQAPVRLRGTAYRSGIGVAGSAGDVTIQDSRPVAGASGIVFGVGGGLSLQIAVPAATAGGLVPGARVLLSRLNQAVPAGGLLSVRVYVPFEYEGTGRLLQMRAGDALQAFPVVGGWHVYAVQSSAAVGGANPLWIAAVDAPGTRPGDGWQTGDVVYVEDVYLGAAGARPASWAPDDERGRWDYVDRSQSVWPTHLRERAEWLADTFGIDTWSLDLAPGAWAERDVQVGDGVLLRVDGVGPLERYEQAVRIEEVSVEPSPDGGEEVKVAAVTLLGDHGGRTANLVRIHAADQLADLLADLSDRVD